MARRAIERAVPVVEGETRGSSVVERPRIDGPRRGTRAMAARTIQVVGERRIDVRSRVAVRARRRRELEIMEPDRSPLLAVAWQRVTTLAREILVRTTQPKPGEVMLERCSVEVDQTLTMIGVAFGAVALQPATVHRSMLVDSFRDRGMAGQTLLVGDGGRGRMARGAILERLDSAVRARQGARFDEFACTREDVGKGRYGITLAPGVTRGHTQASGGGQDQETRAKAVQPTLAFFGPAILGGSASRMGPSPRIAASRSLRDSTDDPYCSG